MEQTNLDLPTAGLIDSVRTAFEAGVAEGAEAAPYLGRVLPLLSKLRLDSARPEAVRMPVCRHLPRALELGEAGPAAPVARAFRRLEPTLEWRQNPRYSVENRGAAFMENYAFTTLGLLGGTDLYVGMLLLGPGMTYPLTSYPSEGVFLVVAGNPEWKRGDADWAAVPAGSIVYRPPNGAEGKRPGDEPLLALYAWIPL